MKLEIDGTQRATHDTSHDRLSVFGDGHRTLIALADGADSSPGAQVAAARAVDELALCFRNGALPEDAQDWVMVLETIDRVTFSDPDAGETSALVMLVQRGVVVGASVGNSLAYIVRPIGEPRLLTSPERTGPRIGTGIANPIGFGPVKLDGKLVTRRAARFDQDDLPTAVAANESKPTSGKARDPLRKTCDRLSVDV